MMIFAIIKQHLINFFLASFAFLMAIGGFFILFGLPMSRGNGVHIFEGPERLIGLVPILIGGVFFLMILMDWKPKIEEVKAGFQPNKK